MRLWLSPGIADRLAGGGDPAAQGGFRDNPAIPDGVEDLVLADDAVVVLQQESQEIEYLRLQVHDFPAPAQLVPPKIQLIAVKDENSWTRRCLERRQYLAYIGPEF